MADYFFYKGQMYRTDELKHWKYVKREKKNGKWVYYYDNQTDKKLAAAKYQKNEAVRKAREANYAYDKARYMNEAANTWGISEGMKKERAENEAKTRSISKQRTEEARDAKRTLRKIKNKASIEKLAIAPVAKGAAYIANLLSGAGNKKRPKTRSRYQNMN